jgi:hypothetical protein
MTNLYPIMRDQDSEALYWLDVAKRVLRGDISPHEASQVLKLDTLTLESSAQDDDQPT